MVPEWHRVPGTSFVVDHFGRKVEEAANCKSWFLTHFHADHYMGLNGRFKSGTPAAFVKLILTRYKLLIWPSKIVIR